MTASERLRTKAEEHERRAAALRLAADELDGGQAERKQARGVNGVIQQAIALRNVQAQQNGHGGARRKPTAERPGVWSSAKLIRRRKTAKLLAKFSDEPKHGGPAAATLTRHGYLKAEGDGLYTRTSKVFVP